MRSIPLLLLLLSPVLQTWAFVPGDTNGDGTVDLKDVSEILQWVHSKGPLSAEKLLRGDCYPFKGTAELPGDGHLDQEDIAHILRMAIGLKKPVDLGPVVITIAGSGNFGRYGIGGWRDGPALEALFSDPWDVAVDQRGWVYITDSYGHRIRALTPEGMVTTIAGTGEPGYRDGPALEAQFDTPYAITLGPDGSLYIADNMNHCIRRITPDLQRVETVAGTGERGYRDGPTTEAQFAMPTDVQISSDGRLWVADTGNNRIRRIDLDGKVITVAGSGRRGWRDGPSLLAEFAGVTGLWIEETTGEIYVAEVGNHLIRKISPKGQVVTVSGIGKGGYKDGPVSTASFNLPFAFEKDRDGGLLIVDWGNGSIRKLKDGVVTTLAGIGKPGYRDGLARNAQFNGIMGIALDPRGDIYCADTDNQRIRKVIR